MIATLLNTANVGLGWSPQLDEGPHNSDLMNHVFAMMQNRRHTRPQAGMTWSWVPKRKLEFRKLTARKRQQHPQGAETVWSMPPMGAVGREVLTSCPAKDEPGKTPEPTQRTRQIGLTSTLEGLSGCSGLEE